MILIRAAILVITSLALRDSPSAIADSVGTSVGTHVGIDIDTSYARVAVVRNGSVTVLRNEQGSERTPVYVAFTPSGRLLVGDEAKCQAVGNPNGTVFSVLPLLGSSNFDSDTVQRHIKRFPYKLKRGDANETVIVLQRNGVEESFAPVEILAMLLRRQRQMAEEYLGEKVSSAVISVPSCLSYTQIRAITDAGRIAGFTGELLVVEATVAAGVAYGFTRGMRNPQLLVVNAGDNSLGVGVVEFSDKGDVSSVLNSCSNEAGGDTIHQTMQNHLLDVVENKNGKQLADRIQKDATAMEKLRREVERAIRTFSTSEHVIVQIEHFINGDDFSTLVTRSQFKKLIDKQLLKMQDLIKSVRDETDFQASEINEVALIGGLSQIPAIQDLIVSLISYREPTGMASDPSMWPVIGAAAQASYLGSAGGSPAVVTLCPGTFGYWTAKRGFVPMLNPGEPLVSTNSRQESMENTGRMVTEFSVKIYEKVKQEGLVNYVLIDTIVMEISPTEGPDLWINFTMERYNKLQVTVSEMKTSTEQTWDLTHQLSAFRMQSLGRKAKALFQQNPKLNRSLKANENKQEL